MMLSFDISTPAEAGLALWSRRAPGQVDEAVMHYMGFAFEDDLVGAEFHHAGIVVAGGASV